MYLTTEGLILRQADYQDSGKILTVLTKDSGKLTMGARGVRRKNSRLAAGCQLLGYSEFTCSERGGYCTVTEASPKELFSGLRTDLERLSLASYFAQLLEAVSEEDCANPELLRLGLNALYALSERKVSQPLCKAAFELRLMCMAGYEPDLTGCAACGEEEPDGFDILNGVLVCRSCRTAENGQVFPLPSGALAAMRHITSCELRRLFAFTLALPALERLGAAAEAYLCCRLERGFGTLDYYHSLFSGQTLPGLEPTEHNGEIK